MAASVRKERNMNYPFETAARRGDEPSDELTPAELVLYERLRTIYALYDLNRIDAEAAKAQKERAERKYREMDCVWSNCEAQVYRNIRLWRELEQYANAYRTHDRSDLVGLAKIADAILKTIYRVGEKNESQT